jgi:hypothetical protein
MLALPPVGSASFDPQMLQRTTDAALLKITCSFPQSGHFTWRKKLLGLGMIFSQIFISTPHQNILSLYCYLL